MSKVWGKIRPSVVEAQKNHEDHKDEGHRSALRPSKSDLSSNFDEEDQRVMNWSA